MNKLFLETICEGYLYDKKCFDKTYADKLSDALLDSLKEIREEDINLYFQIAQMNQSQQRKLFISLLEFEQIFTDKYCDLLLHEEESLENDETLEEDFISFNLGKYIAQGVNEPKKYPNKPFLEDKIKLKAEEVNETKVMSIEEMKEVMRKNTLILGGTIKKNGKANS